MRIIRPLATFAAALMLAALVAGCGLSARAASPPGTASTTAQPEFVRLTAIRTSMFPSNRVPAFDETTTDQDKIARLYADILALKPFPEGVTYFCPMDAGVLYHLTFTLADGSQLMGYAKPDGCEYASIGAGPHGQILDADGFWSLFADTFGVPMSALSLASTNGTSSPLAPQTVP